MAKRNDKDMLRKDCPTRMGLGVYEEDEDDEDLQPPRKGSGSNSASALPGKTATTSKGTCDTANLNRYCTDLTKAASDGKLDPMIGRDAEIERLVQTLSRRKKNNPVLVGNPGVGKTAIVEGLAQRIVQSRVPHVLLHKRILSLDLPSMVAGTMYRGQFEERIVGLIKELKGNPDIILFIDEIHTLVGMGSATGSGDASNILKPALARGEVRCIGATTLDEYRKYFEKDGALERRFQKILVEPTNADDTLVILQQIKRHYEDYHHVTYTDAALAACVKLSERYITDRFLPDKAIDALDEAGSRTHIINVALPQSITDQEKKVADLTELQGNAAKSQNYELATVFRDEREMANAVLNKMRLDWEKSLQENRRTVTEDDIATVIAMMSGVPVQRIAEAENQRLMSLETNLSKCVIGQEKAIETISKAIRRGRVGLKDPNRPIGVFMFLGPTGVGKTYLAKELARQLFGSADALIRIDMSEYTEKFAVSRLVGAPPGYVGYDEGGQLTEQVRRKPYSIVLLDEIEKADPQALNLLLQVMDEGHLTDSTGRKVDFKNTIIILTSNVGSRRLKDFSNGIGFAMQDSESQVQEYSRSIITKALNKTFSPEFLNRLDEIISFNSLEKDDILKIVDIEIGKLQKRASDMGYQVEVDGELRQFIAKKGFDPVYGARPLKRAIQMCVEDKLSELILKNESQQGATITIGLDENTNE